MLLSITCSFALPSAHAETPSTKPLLQLPEPLIESDFRDVRHDEAMLGQLLFHDKLLSGNRNIACNTCHTPEFGTSDGLPLGIGEGGVGIGPSRTAGTGEDRIRKRIPRNSPGLWNLGAKDLHVLFHDGRVSVSDDYDNGFNTPAQEWLPGGLDNLLAAQALFPLTAQFEMAGNPKENEVAGARHDRIDAVWPILTKRVINEPEYLSRLISVYGDVSAAKDVTIAHIANALAAFMAFEWQSIDSPFDAYLRGNISALNQQQQAGMALFFGKANCSQCHSGSLLSDQKFHAIGVPPLGPGRTRQFDPIPRDVGFMGESDRLEDRYKFRTPMLRNVALTAPYGHNGALKTLEDAVRHHLDPLKSLNDWRFDQVELPEAAWLSATDFIIWQDAAEMARYQEALSIQPIELSPTEIENVVSFLHTLTGTRSLDGRLGKPTTVPSGLSVD